MYDGVGKTVDILKSDLLDLPKAIVTFEETLLDIRSGVDPLEIFHAGRGDTLEPEVRKLVEQKQTVFVPSGLDSFDSRAGGFTRGDLVVLASHVSGGKTWLMLNMSINEYLKYALNTFVASLEMSREQILGRAIANISSVSHTLIRKGDLQPVYKKDIMQAYQDFKKHGELRGCRFTLHASSRLTPRSLEAMVKPLGYDVIFIDYLNLMQHDTDNNLPLWQRLGEIIRDLKLMALRLNVVIVLATQMGEGDIVRYSRMIKEHADFLWIWKCLDQEKAEGQVKITQDKARNIEQFPFLCGIDFDKGLFGQPSIAGEDLRWKPQGVPSSQVTNVMTELQRSSG
jgi:replicative DNA helicase